MLTDAEERRLREREEEGENSDEEEEEDEFQEGMGDVSIENMQAGLMAD